MEGFLANKITEEIKKKKRQKWKYKKIPKQQQQMSGRQFSSMVQNIHLNNEYSPPQELNTVLQYFFFCEVHKGNGKEYKPASLANIQTANR